MFGTLLAAVIVFEAQVECTHISERVTVCTWQEQPSGQSGTDVCVDGECFDITNATEEK